MLVAILAAEILNSDLMWTERPSGGDIAVAYPPAAMRESLNGRANMLCVVDGGGRLTDCVVDYAEPEGQGFDQAALKLSRKFRLAPKNPSGEAVEGRSIPIPIWFVLPGATTLPVTVVQRAGVVPTQVTIGCRLNVAGRLDNCFAFHLDPAAKQVALDVVAEANASPHARPRRRAARVNIPIEINPTEPR